MGYILSKASSQHEYFIIRYLKKFPFYPSTNKYVMYFFYALLYVTK